MSGDRPPGRRIRVTSNFGPSSSTHRSLRRVRARGFLNDALGQGLVLIFSAVVTASSGFWFLLTDHDRLAGLTLILATVEIVTFVILAFRALKRDKAIQFWAESRQQRLELTRETAYRELLLCATEEMRRQQLGKYDYARTEGALAEMVVGTFEVCTPNHDDLAVLLVREDDRRCEIIHSALSQGSRWDELRSGKHCILEGDLQDRLQELAPARFFVRSIATRTQSLSLVVLHDSVLDRDERYLLRPLAGIFESVASGWAPGGVDSEHKRLRVVR